MTNHSRKIMRFTAILLLAGCTKSDTMSPETITGKKQPSKSETPEAGSARMVMYKAEYITSSGSRQIGQTVFFKDVGNKQSGDDFVPGDPRRQGRTNITYAIDNETTNDNGLTLAQTSGAIDRAMATWDAQKCSDLNITRVPGADNMGFVSALVGFSGSLDIYADIQHSGWLPAAFFDIFAPGGSNNIIAITFTIIWVDENGFPTDIDRNKKTDVAMREIYYNDNFSWGTTGAASLVDIESIALHESGHALSQGHFGKGFATNANGKLHIAPRAVMNAVYLGVQRTLLGTDNGGHCSNWASWPRK